MFLFWKDKAEHLEIESKNALQLTIPVPGAKIIRFDNAVICRTAAGIIERMPLGVDQRKSVGNTNSDNFWAASGNCDGTRSRSVVAGRDNYDEPKIPEGFHSIQ